MELARPTPVLPRKGRQQLGIQALASSPCPQRTALRERGEAAQPLRGVFFIRVA